MCIIIERLTTNWWHAIVVMVILIPVIQLHFTSTWLMSITKATATYLAAIFLASLVIIRFQEILCRDLFPERRSSAFDTAWVTKFSNITKTNILCLVQATLSDSIVHRPVITTFLVESTITSLKPINSLFYHTIDCSWEATKWATLGLSSPVPEPTSHFIDGSHWLQICNFDQVSERFHGLSNIHPEVLSC